MPYTFQDAQRMRQASLQDAQARLTQARTVTPVESGRGIADPAPAQTMGAGRSSYQGQIDTLLKQLQARAAGQGPSLADLVTQQSADQAMAQQRSLAASARPGQGALANLVAAQNIGRINQGMGHQQMMGRLAERDAAAQQLAQLIAQSRGGDVAQQQVALQGQELAQQKFLEMLRQKFMYDQLAQQQHQFDAQQPKWWEKLFGGLAPIAASYAGRPR